MRPNTDRIVRDSIFFAAFPRSSSELTDQTLSVFRVPIEIFAVGHHAASQVGNREGLFFVVTLIALGDSLDIGGHGFMNALNA